MRLTDAMSVLDSSGAKDITSAVGIQRIVLPDEPKLEDLRDYWYILAGDTCLHLTSGRIAGAPDASVCAMELGERGKGYGNKIEWLQKQKHSQTKVIEL